MSDQEMALRKVQNMRTAAVLLAYGFTLQNTERSQQKQNTQQRQKPRVEFTLMVGAQRLEEFDRLFEMCGNGLHVPLPGGATEDGRHLPDLGDYEAAFARIRDLVDSFTKANKEEYAHGKSGQRATRP